MEKQARFVGSFSKEYLERKRGLSTTIGSVRSCDADHIMYSLDYEVNIVLVKYKSFAELMGPPWRSYSDTATDDLNSWLVQNVSSQGWECPQAQTLPS